ncbi:uncharacterized protein LOC114413833 [Glycine soja]|uniref:arp2/3 complex-activating protein rickA-like n=1 Tax=Glycine max TaxID=3847 RepID=UPI0007190EC3|nr:arp2/3 complex-activating protein rickA-like [Glycine max]XP_028234158.1 uncharacterized protein LOC114413833 [Glycine soja]|eukprot:XP_014631421.1 uncharacterized protein LOC106798764 [Glycine max]
MAEAPPPKTRMECIEEAIAKLPSNRLHVTFTLEELLHRLTNLQTTQQQHHSPHSSPSSFPLQSLPPAAPILTTPLPPLLTPSLPPSIKPPPSPTCTTPTSMPTPPPRPALMPQHPAPWPTLVSSREDTTRKLVAPLHLTLPFESGNNSHRDTGLPLNMLNVGNRVPQTILEKVLTNSASQTANSEFHNDSHVVTQHLLVSLGSSIASLP